MLAAADGLLSGVKGAELIATGVYALLGLFLFFAAYFIFERVAPFPVRKELVEDNNVAVGVIVAGMMIGLAIILSAAMKG